MLSAVYASVFYTVGLSLNPKTLSEIANSQMYGMLVSSYFAFFLIAFFFGYPAYIIKQIENAEAEIGTIHKKLEAAHEFLLSALAPAALSEREQQILECLATGKTNAQIANELYISETTVKNHLYRTYKKLGVNSRELATLSFLVGR